MEKEMHLAAQYLAAAGISFLDKKPDDSHTNLGFSSENRSLYTHPLSDNGDVLCLDYERFALDWKSNKKTTTLSLDGATHAEVLKWITDTSKTFLNKTFQYTFHYNLPYTIDDAFTFKVLDKNKLIELMQLRILAQLVLEKIDKQYDLNASIRIWPHHFDTGIYKPLPDSDITIGLGLAIPDSVCNKHYFYITGYKNSSAIDTAKFSKLEAGEWKSEGFTGAILNTDNVTQTQAVAFFEEVINQLSS